MYHHICRFTFQLIQEARPLLPIFIKNTDSALADYKTIAGTGSGRLYVLSAGYIRSIFKFEDICKLYIFGLLTAPIELTGGGLNPMQILF